MLRFAKILVGLDIAGDDVTDSVRTAVAHAGALARVHGASLTLVHVIDLPGFTPEAARTASDSRTAKRIARVNAILESMAMLAEDVPVRTLVLFGTHWRELAYEAAREGYDLVVLGTKRRSVAGRMLFGSTGSKLLRTCPCPVWIVKPPRSSAPPRCLVAHDLADAGHVALEVGAAVAATQHGELHVLHVVEHPETSSFLGSIAADERARRIAAAERRLASECAEVDIADEIAASVRDGNAHAEILDYLSTHDISLLVMGSVARSGVAGFLTGNTAENVLPWVDCSLIVVKPSGFRSPVLTHGET